MVGGQKRQLFQNLPIWAALELTCLRDRHTIGVGGCFVKSFAGTLTVLVGAFCSVSSLRVISSGKDRARAVFTLI